MFALHHSHMPLAVITLTPSLAYYVLLQWYQGVFGNMDVVDAAASALYAYDFFPERTKWKTVGSVGVFRRPHNDLNAR